MLQLVQQTKKIDSIIMSLIIIDLGWVILFYVICRTQIILCLQRHLLVTFSQINNRRKKKERKNKDSKHFRKHLLGILDEFP